MQTNAILAVAVGKFTTAYQRNAQRHRALVLQSACSGRLTYHWYSVNEMPPDLTELDLFVLALVQRGCATPYDFKSRAGISVGSSAPILARLEESGFIAGPKPGVRNRRAFSITKSGRNALGAGWKTLLSSRPIDPDAILRTAYLGWALGRPSAVSEFIDASAASLQNAAATRLAEANQLEGMASELGGETFRWLKTTLEAARLESQSVALKELGRKIKNQQRKPKQR